MPNLVISNLTKSYNGYTALKDFSMSIEEGEIVGLVGKNGAGKTTLLNCIAGNIHPDKGEIKFQQEYLTNNSSIINDFGILIQASFLEYINTYDNLKLLSYASGVSDKNKIDENINEVLYIVGLSNEKLSYVKSFSFGMKQRLGLAQALINGKKFLILDEPLVGLDVLGREIVKSIIINKAKKDGISVLFSDHNLREVEDICDKIVCLENGEKVFDGVFKNEKEYCIEIDKINIHIINKLRLEFKECITIEEKSIKIKGNLELNNIISSLVKDNIFIKEISVEESSLIKMFKEGI
ncbi:ABC transporter ATP-binding protein (plasmid) [Paraclostridium ghonii]|uniref:ABC transporter ATP-binding protein n=1 Tax=Paraclostridium ghonii TaxID=29358 RepID=UPI00202D0712|nr:ABC transporter ATP-binding protein [Paeniclostridium ghonii]MCM0165524.1 ABC transporter ATP-binding protein [Paeniclostridium ghonii]